MSDSSEEPIPQPLASLPEKLIACSGEFSGIPIYDLDSLETAPLSYDVQPLTGPLAFQSNRNDQVVHRGELFNDSEISNFVVANATRRSPYFVAIADLAASKTWTLATGFGDAAHGLCSIRPDFSSAPVVVVGSTNRLDPLVICNLETGNRVCEFSEGPLSTHRIASFPDWANYEFYAAGKPGRLSRFDLTRECHVQDFVGHEPKESSAVSDITAQLDSGLLISTSWDRTLRLWSRNDYACVQTIKLNDCGLSLCLNEERKLLAVGLTSGAICFWDLRRTGTMLNSQRFGMQFTNDIIQIDKGRLLAGGQGKLVCATFEGRCRAQVTMQESALVFGVRWLREVEEVEKLAMIEEQERWQFLVDENMINLVFVTICQAEGTPRLSLPRCFV